MEIETLVNELPTMREKAQGWRQREAEARQKAESIERIIEGIEGYSQNGQPARLPVVQTEDRAEQTSDTSDGPRGIGAVRIVMLEDPERVWQAKDVHAALEARGWLSPNAKWPLRGTEAAINRLVNRGELKRLRPGRYRVTEQMKRNED